MLALVTVLHAESTDGTVRDKDLLLARGLVSNVESGFFFFFSSRRRHTRCGRDWSSDVCSSDLPARATIRPSGRISSSCWPVGQLGLIPSCRTWRPTVRIRSLRRDSLTVCAGPAFQIGRASCRERVWISGGGGSVRRKSKTMVPY